MPRSQTHDRFFRADGVARQYPDLAARPSQTERVVLSPLRPFVSRFRTGEAAGFGMEGTEWVLFRAPSRRDTANIARSPRRDGASSSCCTASIAKPIRRDCTAERA